MPTLAWYLKRVRVMQSRELWQRALEFGKLRALHLRYRLGMYASKYLDADYRNFSFCTAFDRQLPPIPFAVFPDDSWVKAKLRGEHSALGFPWRWEDSPTIWRKAPDTGRYWPKAFFDVIQYRQGNPYGDARVCWEPARLQQLLDLALIAGRRNDLRDAAVAQMEDELESWVAGNPPGCGIHYVSAMECALRILSVCFAFDLVREHIGQRERVWCAVVRIVWSHADLVSQRLSLHSSSGNHTIAEAAGLVYAGILFPEMKGADAWLDVGLRTMRYESERQVLRDGGGVERSTWYHLFVVDLLGLVDELLVCKGLIVPEEISDALRRARMFLGQLGDSPQNLLRMGDDDGGYALSSALRLSFGAKRGLKEVANFPEYGVSVVRTKRDVEDCVVFDYGPLGMPPAYGHGHADALSVLLRVGSDSVLIDPGTYTYNGDPLWRSYFRSSRGHNTVTIDGQDQARQETAFMWSRPFESELAWSDDRGVGEIRFLGRHNGYRDMGIIHWRGVLIVKGSYVVVWDRIVGRENRVLELNWHTGVAIEECGAGEYRLNAEAGPLTLALRGGVVTAHIGETRPVSGWRSTQYGRKIPVTTLTAVYRGQLPHEFFTVAAFPGYGGRQIDLEGEATTFREQLVKVEEEGYVS